MPKQHGKLPIRREGKLLMQRQRALSASWPGREGKPFSDREIAEAAGWNKTAIGNLLATEDRGDTNQALWSITWDHLLPICQMLRISPYEVLDGLDDEQRFMLDLLGNVRERGRAATKAFLAEVDRAHRYVTVEHAETDVQMLMSLEGSLDDDGRADLRDDIRQLRDKYERALRAAKRRQKLR